MIYNFHRLLISIFTYGYSKPLPICLAIFYAEFVHPCDVFYKYFVVCHHITIDKLKIWRKQILVETFGGAKQILSGQRYWALKHRVNIDWTFELLNYILALILREG